MVSSEARKIISIILGGGAGTRLYPLTSQRSKPAVPIGGKYRLIDIPISNCLNSGLSRMFVLTQYNSASLNQHIKNTYNFDMFSHGFVDILAAEQTPSSNMWYQGTADAVRQTMHHLRNFEHEYILILSGDQLYQMDFHALLDYHRQQDADVTIATIPVIDRDAPGFGIMKVNEEGFIDSFIEKPSMDLLPDWQSAVDEKYRQQDKLYLASMGIYLFKKEFLHKLFKENPNATDFGKEIIPIAINGGHRVASYSYGGYWEDIGTIRSFFEANIAMTDDVPEFNLFDNHYVTYTRPRLLAPSKIYGTFFNQSVLAEGCIVRCKKLERAIVGIRARVEIGTEISNAIIMGADYYETLEQIEAKEQDPNDAPMGIGRNCLIEKAIIEKDCRVGNNVTIRGDSSLPDTEEDTHVVRDGIIVLKKKCYIPDGAKIGV